MARLQSATPQEMQQALQNGVRNGAGGEPPGFVIGGNGARADGGGAVAGTIIGAGQSSASRSRRENGSTKIVLVSGSTTIAKTQTGNDGRPHKRSGP